MKKSRMSQLLFVLGLATIATMHARAEPQDASAVPQDQAEALVKEYMQTMALVDGLTVYNQQQERLLQDQEREITQLNSSIDKVTYIKRQIGPLTERMIDNLEKFVELDLPFLIKERRARIKSLRDMLEGPDISAAEKFSNVLKAYQEEIDYGKTKQAYTDFIELNGQSRQVDILRWGRVILAFQTPDGEITGAWDNEARQWKVLPNVYHDGVRDGLRIARQTMTNNFVILPTPAPEPSAN